MRHQQARYFLAQFKAQRIWETLRSTRIDEDSHTTSELEIRDQVHAFYQELFTSNSRVVANRVEREVVLSLIKKVSLEENVR